MNRTLLFPRKMREPHPRSSFAIDNQLYSRVEEKILRDRVTREYRLSPRENNIAIYLAQGFTTDEVAEKLSLSPETIETHRRNIYKALDVHTHNQLFIWFVIAISKRT